MGWRRKPRSELAALVARIEVPQPFQLDRFCDSIARERGRPLRLVPLSDAAGRDLPCGLWLGLPEADVIFYEAGAAPILKTQIVLHEISHMLLDHGRPAGSVPPQRAAPATDRELGLDTDRVLALLARSGYTDRQEADAESLATLLLERATRAGAGTGSAGTVRVLTRLDEAFGHPTRRS
ncbi:hypothetical protein [Kitasatospora viridis]|uniref:IrrE N-terminal-like domain-containing protein n=1 Tax=Kitasatospora viridis TaxID=281105 RepID=A0A561UH17_9ACTN|nr:hypothetical protein [Kitasatospora viridis]TWF98660.1 hypothetical protein FHX73_112481 [Kitasatospora viridis]